MSVTNDADTALDPEQSQRVRAICQQGYKRFDDGDFSGAIRQFYAAWTQLPKPQTQWQEATWVLTALGDAYYAKGDYDNGRHALESALHCPGGEGNPIVHLRLGQCLYELGDSPAARRQLHRARELGGDAVFRDAAPQYLALLDAPAQ